MKTPLALALATLLVVLPHTPHAATLTVNPDGTADHLTIQSAVDAAMAGDEIVLSSSQFEGEGNEGVYAFEKELSIRSETGHPENTFVRGTLGRGGFYLECSVIEVEGITFDRNAGDGGGSAISAECPPPTRGVPETSLAVTNCVFVGWRRDNFAGGAIYSDSELVLTGCIFVGNTARDGGAVASFGPLVVSNCEFRGNFVRDSYSEASGGAILSVAGIEMTNSTFLSNNALGSSTRAAGGGALSASSGSISNCRFESNRAIGAAAIGGGLKANRWLSIDGCVFESNLVDGSDLARGGAIGGSAISVTNCEFYENEATGDVTIGGALSLDGERNGEVAIISCVLVGNAARGMGKDSRGGGAHLRFGRVEDCVVTGNLALRGAGLSVAQSSVEGSTIVSNGGTITVRGGGVFVESSPSALRESILWHNCADLQGANLSSVIGTGLFTAVRNAIPDLPGSIDGPYRPHSNTPDDPLLCNPADCTNTPTRAGNYRLQAGSPCLPDGNEWGVLIGALGEGCDAMPIESVTWSRLKQSFHVSRPRH